MLLLYTAFPRATRFIAPFLLLFSAGSITPAFAGGKELLQSLAECSPEYFSQINAFRGISDAGYTFDARGRLVVRNHRDESGSGYRVMGSSEILIDGLRVVGLYDLHRKSNTFEALDWGILVRGEAKDAVKTVNALLPTSRRLESAEIVGLGFARLDITSIKDWPKWTTPRPLPSQKPPEFGDIEMLMEIGPEDDNLKGVVRVGCSMQGVFPPFVMKLRRPDID